MSMSGAEIDPGTGAVTQGQEYQIEQHFGEEVSTRESSPVSSGDFEEPNGYEQSPIDFSLVEGTSEDHQDQIPIRYEQEVAYGQTSDTGIIGGIDITPDAPKVEPKFTTEAHEAVPTFERAATSHNTRNLLVGVGATPLVLRRVGRKYIVLTCPTVFTNYAGVTSTPLGFQVADDRAVIETGQGYQINPGDSIEIDTEGPVFVGPLPGNTSAFIQYSEAYSVPGGPVGM